MVEGELGAVQTPQAFRAGDLLAAYRAAADDGFEGTDTARAWRRTAMSAIAAVPGSPLNLKVTFPEDVALAERAQPGSAEVGERLEQRDVLGARTPAGLRRRSTTVDTR